MPPSPRPKKKVSTTCQQHARLLFPYRVDAVTAYWANQPAPKLLPAPTRGGCLNGYAGRKVAMTLTTPT